MLRQNGGGGGGEVGEENIWSENNRLLLPCFPVATPPPPLPNQIRGGELHTYVGNFSKFLRERDARQMAINAELASKQAEIDKLQVCARGMRQLSLRSSSLPPHWSGVCGPLWSQSQQGGLSSQ